MGNIFKNPFNEGKNNLEQKFKTVTGSGLVLKRKRKSKKAQSESKRTKLKDIFTEK